MKSLPVFNAEQKVRAKLLLATQVASMMGRKFEEGDWGQIYCGAKDIPLQPWSNLHIDVMHAGLGVEHKMLCVAEDRLPLRSLAGTTLMHPSATRSIRVDVSKAANDAMRDVLGQYGELIARRRSRVAETSINGAAADMRVGWLIWEKSLTEFLYFEEAMVEPDPEDFFAEWNERAVRGARKATRNLWVFEKKTGKKRYSITTAAGPKIQPYFDVPPPTDENLYFFRVQSEDLLNGKVLIWVSAATARDLRSLLGDLSIDVVSHAVLELANRANDSAGDVVEDRELAECIELTKEAHAALVSKWDGVSDEHRAQLLVKNLRDE